jgi:hypothetical protein
MALGPDLIPDFLNIAIGPNQERTANDAHESASHKLLFLPDAERLNHFVIGVAQQWKVQFLLGFEFGLSGYGIGAGAKDGHLQLIELTACVAKLGRLNRSTGGAGLRIKK